MYLKSLNCLLIIERLFNVCFSKVKRETLLVASSPSQGTIPCRRTSFLLPFQKVHGNQLGTVPTGGRVWRLSWRWQSVIFSAGSVFERTNRATKNSELREAWQWKLSVFQIPSEMSLAFSSSDGYNFGDRASASVQTTQNHNSPRKLCFVKKAI